MMPFHDTLQRLDELLKRHFPIGEPEDRTEVLWAEHLEGPKGAKRWFDRTFASFLELIWTSTISNRPPWMSELSSSLKALRLAAPPSQSANVGAFCSAIWVEEEEFGERPEACDRDSITGDVAYGYRVVIVRRPYNASWLTALREVGAESAKRTVEVTFGDNWLAVNGGQAQRVDNPQVLAAIQVIYDAWPKRLVRKEMSPIVEKKTGQALDRLDRVWGSNREGVPRVIRSRIKITKGGGGGCQWLDTTPT